MGRYPDEVCPKCKKNHRKGLKSKGEQSIQQTFYYEAHLSNNNIQNQYRWRVYRCDDCSMYVMFITHHKEPKNPKELQKSIDSIVVHMIKLNKSFSYHVK